MIAEAITPRVESTRNRVVAAARSATTPGRLRLAGALILIGAVVFAVVAAGEASTRGRATTAVATQSEPLLLAAEGLYASLADANATAATTFLTGGIEPVAQRQRYVNDLRTASDQLATLARIGVGSSTQARAAALLVTDQLPVYSGLIETARANNRQGFPVGAAYLREASSLMSQQLLPASAQLYQVEARRLDGDYHSGVSVGALIAAIVVCVALLALLAGTQVYLSRVTHRVFNMPMVFATVAIVALAIWLIAGSLSEQSDLASAQRSGSDSVQVLSAVRILALRAQGDESLALIARGGGAQDLADFDAVTARLTAGPGGGLFGEAASIERRGGSSAAIDSLRATFAHYFLVHRAVAGLEANGHFLAAVGLAVGSGARELSLSDALNAGLVAQIGVSQDRFEQSAGSARSAISGLWLGIPLIAALSAGLALYGLRWRINEYR